MMRLKYFDNEGNLLTDYQLTKDVYGELEVRGEREATYLVEEGLAKSNSDAAKIYYARIYSTETSGNYGIDTLLYRAYGYKEGDK